MGRIFESVHGLLLKKTNLPNDDAFLDVFTKEHGRIQISVRKLANSRKKNAEIDFFRFLLFGVEKTRTGNYVLRTVEALQVFSNMSSAHALLKRGFVWLECIRRSGIDSEGDESVFQTCLHCFERASVLNMKAWDVYIRIFILDKAGLFVRFDSVRGDVYFDVSHFAFLKTQKADTIFIPNRIRQIIEFVRREDIILFEEKHHQFQDDEWNAIQDIVKVIEEYHYESFSDV